MRGAQGRSRERSRCAEYKTPIKAAPTGDRVKRGVSRNLGWQNESIYKEPCAATNAELEIRVNRA